MPVIVRPTSRLLVLDPVGRILLFKCEDGQTGRARVFWIPPGGGVEPGETHRDAALRELREETRIETTSLPGACVLEEESVGRHPDFGDREIVYRGCYFAIELSFEEIAQLDSAAVEGAGYVAHRWWSLEELEATAQEVWPQALAAIVRSILAARSLERRPPARDD